LNSVSGKAVGLKSKKYLHVFQTMKCLPGVLHCHEKCTTILQNIDKYVLTDMELALFVYSYMFYLTSAGTTPDSTQSDHEMHSQC
jgi:hypothetical protein